MILNGKPTLIKVAMMVFIILFFLSSTKTVSASNNIDDLNLQAAHSNLDDPVAYFHVGLKDAWQYLNNLTPTLNPVTIGIVDTGFDVTHPEFKDVNLGKTPIFAKFDGGENGFSSHGTDVAGIIGANNISAASDSNYVFPQMNGVVSGVKNLPYILENRRASAAVIGQLTGINLIAASEKIYDLSAIGTQIINLSFGAATTRFSKFLFSQNFSAHPQILFVVSAGNNGRDVNLDTPANLGNLANVLTVGAATLNIPPDPSFDDLRLPDSDFGDKVGIASPGQNVYAPTIYNAPQPLYSGDYEYFTDTSAAAPMVTGVAAILKSVWPTSTPAQVKNILTTTADPLFAPLGSDEAGKLLGSGCSGTPPPDQVLRGCRLNALRAVQAVLSPQPPPLPCEYAANSTLSSDTTWTTGQVCIIHGQLTVPTGVTLTVQPGVAVKFDTQGSLLVRGSINAPGTAAQPIYFTSLKDDSAGGDTNHDGSATSPANGDWGAIIIGDPSSRATFDHTAMRYGGFITFCCGQSSILAVSTGTVSVAHSEIASSGEDGITVFGGSVNISQSSIHDNGGFFFGGVGVYANGPANLSISNTSFANNKDYAGYIALTQGLNFTPSGNTASGTVGIGGFYTTGLTVQNTTFYPDLPYILPGGFQEPIVSLGTTLTVLPGTVVKFAQGGSLLVRGTLDAEGTSAHPVYFTSLFDNAADGRNTSGKNQLPANGDWSAIVVADPSSVATFNHAIVRYGGHVSGFDSFDENIATGGGMTDITNSDISASGEHGITIVGGTVYIASSTIHDNGGFFGGGYGIYERFSPDPLTVNTTAFANNWNGPGAIALDSGVTFLHSGNTSTGTSWNGFFLYGNPPNSMTWNKDLPYIMSGGFTAVNILPSSTLTIDPGVIIKFPSSISTLTVFGNLNARGTTTDKIYFTSLNDNVGGPTSGNPASVPAPGDWSGIGIGSGGSATIDNAVIRYGGGYYPQMLCACGNSANITNSEIASSAVYGIYENAGQVNAANNAFENNAGYAFFNASAVTSTAFAEQNYWNSPSGPTVFSNPLGTGDRVSDYVDYHNWLTSAPAGTVSIAAAPVKFAPLQSSPSISSSLLPQLTTPSAPVPTLATLPAPTSSLILLAQDAQRLSDVVQLQSDLALYFKKCGYYPGGQNPGTCAPYARISSWADLASSLTGSGLGIASVPNDPVRGATYQYGASMGGKDYVIAVTLANWKNPVLEQSPQGTIYGVDCMAIGVYCVRP